MCTWLVFVVQKLEKCVCTWLVFVAQKLEKCMYMDGFSFHCGETGEVCVHGWFFIVQKLEKCYQHLAQAYASVLDVMKSGKRLLGKYFRVAFFGQVGLFSLLQFCSVQLQPQILVRGVGNMQTDYIT